MLLLLVGLLLAVSADERVHLMRWCTEDAACAAAYHLTDTAEPQQLFNYLTGQWLDELQTMQREDVTLRTVWLLEMRLRAHEESRVSCTVNEKFVFSTDTMSGHCVCVADRNCNNDALGTNFASLTMAGLLVALALMIVMSLYNSVTRVLLYHRLSSLCRGKCDSRAQLMKDLAH